MVVMYGAWKNVHVMFLDMKYGLFLLVQQYSRQYLFESCVREQGLTHSKFFSFIQEQ